MNSNSLKPLNGKIKEALPESTMALGKMREYSASVVILTYKRALLIERVLASLLNQSYKDFQVLVVLKPSGDTTEVVLEKYQKLLNIKVVKQTAGYVIDAYNLGLQNADGKIIIFLDDDAIPSSNFVQAHVESYLLPNVAGVAGNVITATVADCDLDEFRDKPSEIINETRQSSLKSGIEKKLWDRPIEGQENYLIYLSRAGAIINNSQVAIHAKTKIIKSLLAKGANMSVSSKAVEDFKFPNSWILGFTFEQFLGWHIWKKGGTLVFNPEIRVYHLDQGQSLSRNTREMNRRRLLCAEDRLLFYRLYDVEPNLSLMYRLVWIIKDAAVDLKRMLFNKESFRIALFKTKLYSELIGLRWLLYKKIGSDYSPLSYLTSLNRAKQNN